MLQIEQIIRRLESIESCGQLETFLNEVGSSRPYSWCCLLVQSDLFDQYGQVPVQFHQTIKTLDLRYLAAEQYKPHWRQDVACGAIPLGTVYVPIKTQGTHCACILFGAETELVSDLLEKLSWYWQILATYIYDAYRRCQPAVSHQYILTKRELECLHWVAQGKTSWEVGQILGISERTVNFHIGNSIEKTGCVNRQQLASKYMNIY